jgi:hypothetical protein
MKVIWKGSIELVTGIEKITLEAPEGTEDELHMLRMAAKKGKQIVLVIADDITPDQGKIALLSEIRAQLERLNDNIEAQGKE